MARLEDNLLLPAVLTAGLALLAHWRFRRYVATSLVAGVLAGICWFMVLTVSQGPSNIWPVALVFWMALLLPIAFLVGLPFLLSRLRVRSGVNRCARCEYDLTGNTTGVCPECGATVNREAS